MSKTLDSLKGKALNEKIRFLQEYFDYENGEFFTPHSLGVPWEQDIMSIGDEVIKLFHLKEASFNWRIIEVKGVQITRLIEGSESKSFFLTEDEYENLKVLRLFLYKTREEAVEVGVDAMFRQIKKTNVDIAELKSRRATYLANIKLWTGSGVPF